jgi:uncharacterized membrane protein YozB (DUF420 family)
MSWITCLSWTIWICIIALATLCILIGLVWFKQWRMEHKRYQCFLALVVILTVLYAVVTVWQLTTRVAIPGVISPVFRPLLVGYLIFWVAVPPVWFFFEYFAFENGWITQVGTNPINPVASEAQVKRVKDYQDVASKVWAALVVLLGGLVALSK